MELPIFNDNLRSSANWAAQLAVEQERWKTSGDSPERLRQHQVENILRRSANLLEQSNLLKAADLISGWASDAEAKLSPERLLQLHTTLVGVSPDADVLRKTEPLPLNAFHDPTPAILLPKMIDHAFDWFSTESFAELHAVEQAAVVYLRLLDLHPFTSANEPTAIMTASFYTERAGLPPLVILSDDITQARFAQAFEAAFRMLTQPLVEMFAEMLRLAMQSDQPEVSDAG